MKALLDRHVFPRINDLVLGDHVRELRAAVAGQARGRVLEIGAGSGLNFAAYSAEVELVALEPAEGMRRVAQRRAREAGRRITIVDGKVERLPFDAGSFDEVVGTFVLCSVRSLEQSLDEVRRVLKPGGRLRLVEHVRSPEHGVARWQERLRPLWMTLLGGCDPTRELGPALDRAGFDASAIERLELPLPKLARAGLIGAAVLRG